MYLMTDEDHDEGRDEADVVRDYNAAYIPVAADGEFPVFIERDRKGEPISLHIDCIGGDSLARLLLRLRPLLLLVPQ
jgi:hypothetical protein